jgi:hypothetical protein
VLVRRKSLRQTSLAFNSKPDKSAMDGSAHTTESVAKINAHLATHNHGTNKFILGETVVPSFVEDPHNKGTVIGIVVDRSSGENLLKMPLTSRDKAPTWHLTTKVVKIYKQYTDVTQALMAAKKDVDRTEKGVNQTIMFELNPTDERLASSQSGNDDLIHWIMKELPSKWLSVKYHPNKSCKQAAAANDSDVYATEAAKCIMETSQSPFMPLQDSEDASDGQPNLLWKTSLKTFPMSGKTKQTHADILTHSPVELSEYADENPEQRVQFVDLLGTNGKPVPASEYWNKLQTAFCPGSLAIVTMMVPYGGFNHFQGSKCSFQPKLVSMQEVEPGEAQFSGGGACDLSQALSSYDAATALVNSDPPSAKRSNKEERKGGGKKAKKNNE